MAANKRNLHALAPQHNPPGAGRLTPSVKAKQARIRGG